MFVTAFGIDPETPLYCPDCAWAGKAIGANCQLNEVVRCPYCSAALLRDEPDEPFVVEGLQE